MEITWIFKFKKSKEEKIFIENKINNEYENLLIYPSMDKYISSRKAPFISYLDRFRKYLLENEKVLIILDIHLVMIM